MGIGNSNEVGLKLKLLFETFGKSLSFRGGKERGTAERREAEGKELLS